MAVDRGRGDVHGIGRRCWEKRLPWNSRRSRAGRVVGRHRRLGGRPDGEKAGGDGDRRDGGRMHTIRPQRPKRRDMQDVDVSVVRTDDHLVAGHGGAASRVATLVHGAQAAREARILQPWFLVLLVVGVIHSCGLLLWRLRKTVVSFAIWT